MQFLSHLMILVLLIVTVLLMTAKVSSGFLHRPYCMHSNVFLLFYAPIVITNAPYVFTF